MMLLFLLKYLHNLEQNNEKAQRMEKKKGPLFYQKRSLSSQSKRCY